MTPSPNLLLQFKVHGESKLSIERASRIKIDGRGCLLVYEDPTVASKRISLDSIGAFSIQSLENRPKISATPRLF